MGENGGEKVHIGSCLERTQNLHTFPTVQLAFPILSPTGTESQQPAGVPCRRFTRKARTNPSAGPGRCLSARKLLEPTAHLANTFGRLAGVSNTADRSVGDQRTAAPANVAIISFHASGFCDSPQRFRDRSTSWFPCAPERGGMAPQHRGQVGHATVNSPGKPVATGRAGGFPALPGKERLG